LSLRTRARTSYAATLWLPALDIIDELKFSAAVVDYRLRSNGVLISNGLHAPPRINQAADISRALAARWRKYLASLAA
jgi:hypothetical protein